MDDRNSEVLMAIREIAANQAELSRSLTRTQQEMVELRSVINSARPSRASSRQSIRPREREVVDDSRREPTGLSGDETPGLDTVTESDSDRDDWYEDPGEAGGRSDPCRAKSRCECSAPAAASLVRNSVRDRKIFALGSANQCI